MKIDRFEDIVAWQEARVLVKMIYDVIKANGGFYRDFKLREQITGAAVSIMSNIAEGFSRRTRKEFIQFLFIAKGSAAEVQSQLYVVLDQGYISQERFHGIYNQADKTARLISGFITYLLKEPNKLNKLNQPNKPKELKEPNKHKELKKLKKLKELKEPNKPEELNTTQRPYDTTTQRRLLTQ